MQGLREGFVGGPCGLVFGWDPWGVGELLGEEAGKVGMVKW